MAVSARRMRHIHGVLTIFWAALWVTAYFADWLSSVAFVSHVSMAALVLTQLGGWQGARAEEKADSST